MPTSWSKHHPAFSLSLRLIVIPQSLHFKDLWSCSIRYMFADAPSHLTECRITGPLLWSTYIVTTDCGPNYWWNWTISIIVHIPKLLWDQLLMYVLHGAVTVIKDKLCSESVFVISHVFRSPPGNCATLLMPTLSLLGIIHPFGIISVCFREAIRYQSGRFFSVKLKYVKKLKCF